MILFACPECGNELSALSTDAGKNVECRLCSKQATVPLPTSLSEVANAVTVHIDDPFPTKAPGNSPTGPEDGSLPRIPGFEILTVLGRGGMGVVYQARQVGLNRVVALKMILGGACSDERDRGRFLAEAETVARLHHPNIVQIHEIGEYQGLPFFSLEYCEGGSLAQKLNGTPLPSQDAAQIVRCLARAMQVAHEANIVHRDLKPANILLAVGTADSILGEAPSAVSKSSNRSFKLSPESCLLNAIPKIADFGLAKQLGSDAGHTASGAVLGTPSYMAPEQAGGHKDVGPAADVYALGVILYECLTGRPPFRAATPLDTILLVVEQEPVSATQLNPKVDRDLDTICLKCLQKDPGQRYASAQALADDLQRYLEGRPIAARPVSNLAKLWRLCRRHPGTSGFLALSLLALLGLVATFFTFNRNLGEQLRQNEIMSQRLRMTLAKQIADHIDSDLSLIALVPQTMAGTLSVREDWTPAQIERWTKEMLYKDDRLFGTCVILEPFHFDGRKEVYSHYVYWGPREQRGSEPDAMPITYPFHDLSWYSRPKKEGQGVWTEPYFDEAGKIFMVTYSVPIYHDRRFLGIGLGQQRFVGVATADLSIAYFDHMQKWLEKLNLGKPGYCFVLSPTGEFISHPNVEFKFPKKITEVEAYQDGKAMTSLTEKLVRHESGTAPPVIDPWTGKRSTYFFAPIPSAQWTLVVVVEE